MTGRTKGTDIGGLNKTMQSTATFCIEGAMAISAFPLFCAFVKKSMSMVAALEGHHYVVWLFMLFASAGVLEHAGIKIPFFAFFAHDSGIRAKEPPKNMLVAMGIGAVLCVLIGAFPSALYTLLPMEMDYHPYDTTHVLTQLQLLCFGALGFITPMTCGLYPDEKRARHIDAGTLHPLPGPGGVRPGRSGADVPPDQRVGRGPRQATQIRLSLPQRDPAQGEARRGMVHAEQVSDLVDPYGWRPGAS